MGSSNSLPQTETINWKNIDTNQVSSTIPNLKGISFEANKLVERLNLPNTVDTSSELNDIFLTKNNKSKSTHHNVNQINNNLSESNFSNTSPFISSEMYNYVMSKYNNQNMVGGAVDKNSLIEDSATTSTSSSHSSNNSSSSSEKKDKNDKKDKKDKNDKNDKNDKKDMKHDKNDKNDKNDKKDMKHDKNDKNDKKDMNHEKARGKVTNKIMVKSKINKNKKSTEDFMDYMSSSAHTGGSVTENTGGSVTENTGGSVTENSSIENENNLSISSVRTSQLNLVSE
jgi:hypothetical protein